MSGQRRGLYFETSHRVMRNVSTARELGQVLGGAIRRNTASSTLNV